MTAAFTFPAQFVWDVATAATQIEGGATADGKGPSVWDQFAAKPGRIRTHAMPAIGREQPHRDAETPIQLNFAQQFVVAVRLRGAHLRSL